MFKLKFETDNGAFDNAPREEVARILEEITAKVRAGTYSGKIMDGNGNTVGEWSWS
jgi:hypothetical protein